jgi:hypothetical protein
MTTGPPSVSGFGISALYDVISIEIVKWLAFNEVRTKLGVIQLPGALFDRSTRNAPTNPKQCVPMPSIGK